MTREEEIEVWNKELKISRRSLRVWNCLGMLNTCCLLFPVFEAVYQSNSVLSAIGIVSLVNLCAMYMCAKRVRKEEVLLKEIVEYLAELEKVE